MLIYEESEGAAFLQRLSPRQLSIQVTGEQNRKKKIGKLAPCYSDCDSVSKAPVKHDPFSLCMAMHNCHNSLRSR